MPDDRLDIWYDTHLSRWLFDWQGEWIALNAKSYDDAKQEAENIMLEAI